VNYGAYYNPVYSLSLYSPNSPLLTTGSGAPTPAEGYPGYPTVPGLTTTPTYSVESTELTAPQGQGTTTSFTGGPVFAYSPGPQTFTNWPGTFQLARPSTEDVRPTLLRKPDRTKPRPGRTRLRPTAYIDIRVPPRAKVWVEGVRTRGRGELRRFTSPPLPAGREFVYSIRATWKEKGRRVTRKRTLTVRAGDYVRLDLQAHAEE
jgi:uncharacterized protein (TIGR03000 family)